MKITKLLVLLAYIFFSTNIGATTIIFDTGNTNETLGLGLIRPTSYIFDSNGVVDNGQSIAVLFDIKNTSTVNSLSSLFNVTYSGGVRVSIFDNKNAQPGDSLVSKVINITSPGWQGINGFELTLTPNYYWAVFDFPPEIWSTFSGSLVFYDVGDKTKTFIKSNYSTEYISLGSDLSTGLILTGSVTTPVPESNTTLMLTFGLLAVFSFRKVKM
ncbi:hypothetical protein [Methylophilus medardicus]|uniref:PEP-CTERM sorting domain-containing protein n=1 Tax=Methylophilus medardicus TaxID=2588534 RepID=A0A5B8CU47_9PROT|nr:hypothetical protein [Methylophilus medardicus]QDC44812.1 hypothetical protein FIU01_09960 [Methylophilus medardicus]QDC49819.1 hypothetical protein FIU00_09960 [Methylophilus medardicus]QDC53524.1 hypothetical protein FIT99_09960 [Methylophilus medardicus]